MKQKEMPKVKKGSLLEFIVKENGGVSNKGYEVVGYYRGLVENPYPLNQNKLGEKVVCLTSNNSRDGGNNVYIGFEGQNGYSFLVAKKIRVIRKA
jgi:hypothetical protein